MAPRDLGVARTLHRGGAAPGDEVVLLDYEARFLRRKRLHTQSGAHVLVDLAETVSLDTGDALVLEGGGQVAVQAADEPLIAVRGTDLARLAWHIGNRHAPCQICRDHLLIRADHVLADMLARLGADLRELHGPFRPEGGAYGHGRTMGHAHGPDEGHAHDHGHGHGHGHGPGHDHGHGHGPAHPHRPGHSHG